MPISGAISEAAEVSACRREKGSLHSGRAPDHRGRDSLLSSPWHPERTDYCCGSSDIRPGVHARGADSGLDRAAAATPVSLGLEVLEALAARGEDSAQRSLDGIAGICMDMASIVNSLLPALF